MRLHCHAMSTSMVSWYGTPPKSTQRTGVLGAILNIPCMHPHLYHWKTELLKRSGINCIKKAKNTSESSHLTKFTKAMPAPNSHQQAKTWRASIPSSVQTGGSPEACVSHYGRDGQNNVLLRHINSTGWPDPTSLVYIPSQYSLAALGP